MTGSARAACKALLGFLAACGHAPEPAHEVVALPSVGPPPAASAATSSDCAKGPYIPNTDVCDTALTRDVISFCEQYRKAMEERDTDALLAMASPRYSDEIDYAGLRAKLAGLMKSVSSVRYEVHYRAVKFRADRGIAVEYSYASSYKLGTEWRHSVSDNTLVLERNGPSFLIIRGM